MILDKLKGLRRSAGKLRKLPGYMLLTAADDQLAAAGPRGFTTGWVSLVVLSGLWGVFSACLWELGLWVFGSYSGIHFVPAGIVLAVGTLWLYRRSILSAGELVGGPDPAAQSLVVAVMVALLALVFLSLKGWNEDWAPYPWWLIRPRAMYRALILAPLWGAWAMLATCQFCKPDERTPPVVVAFAAGCGPLTTAICLAGLLAGTILYFNYLPWWQLTISAATASAALASGCAFCRIAGGLSRQALLAAGIITQIVFFLAYLANR